MGWGGKAEGRIFISYRRVDAPGVAGRLSDTLSDYFGPERVFRDIENIEGGADFGQVIEGNLSSADAMIVLIGPEWLEATDESGNRRLDRIDDWVAAEVGAALESGVPVFPVLIEGTPMPDADNLPDRLKPLARRNAVSISDKTWKTDANRLAKIVAIDIPGSVAERRLNRTRALIVLMLLAAVLFTTTSVAFNSHDVLEFAKAQGSGDLSDDALLDAWASAINFVALMSSAVLLFISAPLVDTERRKWIYAGAWFSSVGCLVGLVMYWKPLDGTAETIGLFFISTVLIAGLFGFMTLSGFKPK